MKLLLTLLFLLIPLQSVTDNIEILTIDGQIMGSVTVQYVVVFPLPIDLFKVFLKST